MLELIFLIISLFLLYGLDPTANEISLCFLHNLGFSDCIGCGLGKSIHYFLILDFQESVRHHWFGMFSVFIILYRISQLIKNNLRSYQWKKIEN